MVSESNSVYELLKPQYERRKINYPQMNKWIKDFKAAGHQVEDYYEDQYLKVYLIQTKPMNEVLSESIWSN